MDPERLRDLLARVRDGSATPEEAMKELEHLPFEDLGFARLDHHRALRRGFPEVVFGLGKTPEQVAIIVERLAKQHDRVLVTRTDKAALALVHKIVPDAVYHETARAIVVDRRRDAPKLPGVVILCAGTSDLPVAEEAVLTAELMDCAVTRLYDVGVAGLHRLLSQLDTLRQARVLVVVAGMEGALPSVVSGLVAAPVIAVPTSVGYGASFNGVTALLSMMNSCSPGVSVVNIDNGFGAGYLAATILRAPHAEH